MWRRLVVPAMLVGLLAVATGGAVWWHRSSMHIMSVESGSMAPAIRRGDAVLVSRQPVALKPGDIISFKSPLDQSVLITHRIVSISTQGNTFVTKGDRLAKPDPPFSGALVYGTVKYRLPYIGYVLSFLRTPIGLVLGVYVPALTVVVAEFRRLTRHFSRPQHVYRLGNVGRLL